MPATVLTVQQLNGPYPALPVSANALDVAFTAADTTNGNAFALTGKEVLLVRNTDGTAAHSFTITSVADERRRTGDIANYSLGPGEFAAFAFSGRDALAGWRQSDGTARISADSNLIEFAVLRLP